MHAPTETPAGMVSDEKRLAEPGGTDAENSTFLAGGAAADIWLCVCVGEHRHSTNPFRYIELKRRLLRIDTPQRSGTLN